MSLESLPAFKKRVDAELMRLFTVQKEWGRDSDKSYRELLEDIEHLILRGGKRLRPYLAYLSYSGFGGADLEQVMPLAASLELLHSFLLIHDDIIDQDTVRYGGPNIVGTYMKRFSMLGSSNIQHASESVAILAGDICHIMSSSCITGSQYAPKVKDSLRILLEHMTTKVAEGELVDTIYGLGLDDDRLTEEAIMRLYVSKTASYTFELPLRAGYLLAAGEGDTEMHSLITRLSDALGIAYQLKDDLLGMFGDTAATGKADDGDIREGKRTLMLARARATFGPDDTVRLNALYGKRDATPLEVQEIRELFQEKGIAAYAEELCDTYSDEALALLKQVPFTDDVRAAFKELITKLACRTS